jgi:hypothetical protein
MRRIEVFDADAAGGKGKEEGRGAFWFLWAKFWY